ncbi:Ammonium transporter [Mucor velutinosus]|uniref:Ammonium transporter n=1 Tax=Mucor velutinosus TaxID=708070 RepID=A0AAN7DN36_9FUNG|nr:Ammonium transporter [Mucor velutinosus]
MPGPVTLFSTIGAVGAAASAVVYATKAQSLPDQTSSKNNDNVVMASSYSSFSSNKKLRIGHRNDIHVLMFVVSKD